MSRSTASEDVADDGIVLLGISGSLRRGSLNTALLHAAQEVAPDDVEVVVHPLDGVPLFNRDVEAEGPPDTVATLRSAIAEADGLLLASPEYNFSTSGVLKNAIDWASRRPDAPIDEKPTALVSAAGRSGGARAQRHLRDILQHNHVEVVDPAVQIPRAWDHFDDGRLVTDRYRTELTAVIDELRRHIVDRSDAAAA